MDSLGPMGGKMNEAQKKLYKKLLKNLEAEGEEDELKRMADAQVSYIYVVVCFLLCAVAGENNEN